MRMSTMNMTSTVGEKIYMCMYICMYVCIMGLELGESKDMNIGRPRVKVFFLFFTCMTKWNRFFSGMEQKVKT
jgi:hypothetical protein